MRNLKNSYAFKRLESKFSSFLLHESTPSPLIYFLIFLYSHNPLEAIAPSFQMFLFLVALSILLVNNFNFLFILAPFLVAGPILAVPMLLITLIACNEKWKIYLFVFAVGESAFTETQSNNYFCFVFAGLICIEIYRTLMFRSIRDNIQFFVGMGSISIYYLIEILSNSLRMNANFGTLIPLIITSATFLHKLIEFRIQRLKTMNSEVLSDQQMCHYLKLIENDAINPIQMQANIRNHMKMCKNVNCFCSNKEFNNKHQYLLRRLYESAIQKFLVVNDCLLLQNYIDYLLSCKQVVTALHFLNRWKDTGYFSLIAKCRSKAKIEHYLSLQRTSNLYEKQYAYALQYDQHSLYVAVEINKILKLKLQFWNQVNKETPRVARLQTLGYQIIEKMHQLNLFYNYTIKVQEQKTFVFDSTVLYGMYMLSTTNFKEYAQIIIKNTAKLLEEVYVFENSASETYGMRTVVKNQLKCFSDENKHFKRLQQQHPKDPTNSRNHYKMIIDSVSSGLCKLLHLTKRDLIDKELKTMIPQGYKQIHNNRIASMLDFDYSQRPKKIASTRVIHNEMKLPIKGANGQLVIGYITIKLQADCQKGLTLLSIVKLAHDKSSNMLMDFHGNITEMEEGFNEEIVKHSQVKKYITKMRATWYKEKVINEERFNVMMNSANYVIVINSPFLKFLEPSELPSNPPIHIEVMNEEINRNRNVETDRNNKIGRQIKHMQSAIHNYDNSQSTSSSKAGTQAVNILTSFSENNTVLLYRFLYIAYVCIVTCCIISNIGAYFVTELPWDTTVATNNPINDTMNFQAIQMLSVKGLITLSDELTYFQDSTLNKTRISQYFGFRNYTMSVINFTSNLEQAFKGSLYNLLGSSSNYLSSKINERLDKKISLPSSSGKANDTIQTRFLDLMMIYATDFNLMTNLNLNNTILSRTYSANINKIQNVSWFSHYIDSGISKSETQSIAIHSSLMALGILLLILMSWLLRKRLPLHQKIFDLLVSIDPDEVQRQIKSLQYISNIMRNYKQSNQIMKMNVLDYEENMIHPKTRVTRSSLDNQMIKGLEKFDLSNSNIQDLIGNEGQSYIQSRKSQQSLKITNSINKKLFFKRDSSIGTLIKSKFLSTKQQNIQNKRKRAGELDLEGSILDPNTKIIPAHAIVYAIGISFASFLIASVILNLNYHDQYIDIKENLINTYNDQIQFEQYLLTIRAYLASGAPLIRSLYNVTNELDIIQPILTAVPKYSYYDNDTLYSQLVSSCMNNSAVPATYLQKYCQSDYSEIVLKGEFGAIFKELTQLRFAYDNGLAVYQNNPNLTYIHIKQKFYYLESLNLRLEELVIGKINMLFQNTLDLSIDYKKTKLFLLILSVVWGIICFGFGLAIQIRMKEGYFKDVFMITFLNNQMILKNKRVESFLDSIARNSVI